jgi:hypothetical protein
LLELVAATRYGAKPEHKNTFYNYQHEPNYPGYISEEQRVARRSEQTLNKKIEFQQEDKEKSKRT